MKQKSSRWLDVILCAVRLGLSHPAVAGAEAGFRSLLEGNDLGGWDGDKRLWSIKDGVITGRTTADPPLKTNTFLIWREGILDDFELHFSYRILGGNSGVQYRSKDLGNWSVGGYQADLEAGQTYSGILYEEKGRGILAERGQKTVIDETGKVKVLGSVGNSAELQAAIRHEDWNDYVVVARGNHLIHKINGNVTVDVRDNQIEERSRSGILALQLHVGPLMQVQFKNLRLKRLKLETEKKIVLVAGHPSHAPGDHEANAGVQLLHQSLRDQPGVLSAFYLNGWPSDPSAFDNADAIVFYMDGGPEHPMIQGDHLDILAGLIKKGVGLVCLHYALEVPKEKGGQEFLRWIGGYYEHGFSTNPHWLAEIKELPTHPITRGVRPFKTTDEWYFNIHFRPTMEGVTPILVATPPDEVRQGRTSHPPGPHPHIVAASGREEVLAWAVERPDGGRSFGFTGGHGHVNWGTDDLRKLVLNALLWTATGTVPAGGVQSVVTKQDLTLNLDPKPRRK